MKEQSFISLTPGVCGRHGEGQAGAGADHHEEGHGDPAADDLTG